MVPPLPAVPVPVTVRPPPEPVVSRLMPTPALFDADPALMLRKVRPLAPMVVLATFRPVPLVVAIVFGLAPVVTLTVPPPVAVNPVPLDVVTASPPPEKLTVAPVLFVSVTAVLAAVPIVCAGPPASTGRP